MLKLIFWLLLAANALLLVYQQGYLEPLVSSGREPARMRNQINADKIRVVPQPAQPISDAVPAKALLAAASAAIGESPASTQAASATPVMPVSAVQAAASDKPAQQEKPEKAAQSKPSIAACTEIGNFTAAEARRFQARLAELALAGKSSTREIRETSSHMVFIPPKGGKDGADRKVAELRKLNIAEHYIIQDSSPQRWGISLGIFRSEEAARDYISTLARKGVPNVQLIDYRIALNRLAIQLRGLDAAGSGEVEKLKAGFPRQEIRNCA